MTSLWKYGATYFAGILSFYIAYLNLVPTAHQQPVQTFNSTQSQTAHSESTDQLPQAVHINLTDAQLQFISEQFESVIHQRMDKELNQGANLLSNSQRTDNKPVQTADQQKIYSSVMEKIEEHEYFNGMNIDDISNSDEMKQLSSEQQSMVMSRIFGKLNSGELSQQQVFGK